MNGNNILILKDGTAVAACKSHELQVQGETIEIASATDQTFRDYIAGRKDWSLNVSYLVTDAADLEKVLEVGSVVTLRVRDRSNTVKVQGDAIVVTCKQTYTRGSLANGSYSFKGKGVIRKVTD